MTETHTRTVARTISYRIIAMLITALWTGLGNAVTLHIMLSVDYYIHERIWLKIKWGRIAG